MYGKPWLGHGMTTMVEPRLYHGTTMYGKPWLNHGMTTMVEPRLYHGATMYGKPWLDHGITTMVETWYHGRFCRGTVKLKQVTGSR